MTSTSRVARLISNRIESSRLLQKDIAEMVGFEKPNMITMIKQGKTKLPIAKIGKMAKALDLDPVELLRMCISEYQPDTWKAIEPMFASLPSADEQMMLQKLRTYAGGPYLAAITDESRALLKEFLRSLQAPPLSH